MVQSSGRTLIAAAALLSVASVEGFSVRNDQKQAVRLTGGTKLYDGNGTGGWGIGGSREMVPEEFARSDRSYFDGYKMREQGDFRRQLKEEKDAMKNSELEELLGVAKIAGLSLKNPKERLNKFDPGLMDDDDDLDLSV